MEELGWCTEFPSKAGYILDKSYCFSPDEMRVLSRAMTLLREQSKDDSRPIGKKESLEALASVCGEESLALKKDRAELLAEAMQMNLEGAGILSELIGDDAIEEIAVVGIGRPVRVFVRNAGWKETNCMLTSEEFAVNAVNKLARPLGRRITYATPRLNAGIGNIRIHASIPPLSREMEITIRKFTAEPLGIPEIIENRTITAQAAAFLWLACAADSSVLVAGNTGSGKTTLLNALFSFVPLSERVIVIEETPEMQLPHEHAVRMLASEDLGIGMASLVRDSLRMRPDRVVVGEVRSPEETRALFDSLLAGQAKAAYATFHARSAGEALERLESLGARRSELDAIGAIAVCMRATLFDGRTGKAGETRKVAEIAEVSGGTARQLFSMKDGKLAPTRNVATSMLLERLETNYGMKRKELLAEIQRRSEFLEKLAEKRQHCYRKDTMEMQARAFG